MTEALYFTLINPQQAHAALMGQVWPHIKAHTTAGTRISLVVQPQEDNRSLCQNKFYWGVLLKEISEQARIGGQKYAADAWHELGKRQFLPRKVKKTVVAGWKNKVITISIASTTGLSVRAMSSYLERFSAFAAADLGVTLSVGRWEKFSEERVDMETGEILERQDA